MLVLAEQNAILLSFFTFKEASFCSYVMIYRPWMVLSWSSRQMDRYSTPHTPYRIIWDSTRCIFFCCSFVLFKWSYHHHTINLNCCLQTVCTIFIIIDYTIYIILPLLLSKTNFWTEVTLCIFCCLLIVLRSQVTHVDICKVLWWCP